MSTSQTVRWSPHASATRQRFLRINAREQLLALYDVELMEGKDVRIHEIARHPKISHIRCVDWSALDEDLVCVGQSSGEAQLLRVAHSNSPPVTLSVKHQRSCNSVSFNSDGRFVATGLDKVRNDFCLNIWDIQQRLGQSPSEVPRPCRQLASSDAITSVHFSRDNCNTLVAGVAYKFLRVFDLRESPSNPAISCHTRCVNGISLDLDPNYFASHSDDGIVSIWDRRFARSNPTAEPALLFSHATDDFTRGSSQIASLRYSSTREGAFAVLNAAGGLKVYETAKVSDQEPLASPASSMALHHGLSTDGVMDMHKPRGGWRESATSLLEAGRAYGGTSTSGTRTPSARPDGETLFVTRINDLAQSIKAIKPDHRVANFDWINTGENHATLRVLALRNDGALEIMSCPSPVPSLAWGSRNEFLVTCERDLKMIPAPDTRSDNTEGKPRRKSISPDDDEDDGAHKYTYTGGGSSPEQRLGLHEKRRMERSNSIVQLEEYLLEAEAVLKNDICVTMKRRVESGYEMDCKANAVLTEGDRADPYLNDMWTWLDGARDCAVEGGMTSGPLDLSYLGIYGVWHGGKEATPESRLTTSKRVGREDWTKAAANINKDCGRTPFNDCATTFPEQRRLCLAICDWNYDAEELEYELRELERDREYTKAAGWALFYGDINRCIQSLRKGGQQLRIMATAVAGYFAEKRLATNRGGLAASATADSWKMFASELATELHDPHMRAIFAYVSTGDWIEVLDEIGLPLRERIGIALRWLPDSELSNFVETATRAAVLAGDLEGIVLTGLAPRAVDLLQVYINRTGDVQTAALAASFAMPRYFTDHRVAYWVDSYRQLLNSWRTFHARARFDVARGRNSRGRNGAMLLDAPRRQVYVRCANCDRSIAHVSRQHHPAAAGPTGPGKKDTSKPMTLREKQSSAALSGSGGGGGGGGGAPVTKLTVCPHCKKSLPRCAVCLLTLGTAVGSSRRRGGLGCNLGTIGGGGGIVLAASEPADVEEDYDRWFNFCLACNHGMHAGHAKEWFDRHRICPVPDCTCACKM